MICEMGCIMIAAICDDNRLWLDTAEQILRRYAVAHRVSLQVLLYQTVSDLLAAEDAEPDILFMDIEFRNQPEGIACVKTVNERWPDCQVVYLTDYLHYALDVYQTEHMWYVLKDQFEERLPDIADKLRGQTDARPEKLVVTTVDRKLVNVFCDEISYLERNERVTRIVTKHETLLVRERIPALMERLPQGRFARCHNSYVVALSRVRQIHAGSLTMEDGSVIFISRSYAKRFRERFLEWANAGMV